MELYWVSEFEVGNEWVDLQHRYFLDLINRIGKSFKKTNDDDYRRKLIIELHKYAEFHFASEENIAISCGIDDRTSSSTWEWASFYAGTGNAMGGIRTTGVYTDNPAFYNGSDRRIKTDFKKPDPILDKLLQVNIWDYALKENIDARSKSPIAQELYEIFPEFVVKTDNGEGEDLQ